MGQTLVDGFCGLFSAFEQGLRFARYHQRGGGVEQDGVSVRAGFAYQHPAKGDERDQRVGLAVMFKV